LDSGELAESGLAGLIAQHRCPRHARRNLLEQFQPFPACAVFEQRKTGGVAAGPCQAPDQARADRIGGGKTFRRILEQQGLGALPPATATRLAVC